MNGLPPSAPSITGPSDPSSSMMAHIPTCAVVTDSIGVATAFIVTGTSVGWAELGCISFGRVNYFR